MAAMGTRGQDRGRLLRECGGKSMGCGCRKSSLFFRFPAEQMLTLSQWRLRGRHARSDDPTTREELPAEDERIGAFVRIEVVASLTQIPIPPPRSPNFTSSASRSPSAQTLDLAPSALISTFPLSSSQDLQAGSCYSCPRCPFLRSR